MKTFKYFYNNNNVILTEGGAAGHMSHVFEDYDLTFGELKDLLSNVFTGKLELTEKTDGQNISVTWKNGKIGLARNKETIKEPLTVEQTAKKFEDRGEIKNAFVNSLKDIEKALKTVEEDTLNYWFGNGTKFLSIEVIYPPTKNVVDYNNRCLLQLHGMQEYDDKANKVGEDKELAKEIFTKLNDNNALQQENFAITGPQALKVNNITDSRVALKKLVEDIDKLEKEYELSDSSTIKEYCQKCWKKIISERFPNLDDEQTNTLVDKFAGFAKSGPNKTQIVKKFGIEKSDYEALEKEQKKIQADIIEKIEVPIIKASGLLLNNLVGYVSINPNATVQKLRSELEGAIQSLKDINTMEFSTISKNLAKLEKVGYDIIAPVEGIVFQYKGKLYKLTGAFGPINQLMGVFKFGKR